MLITVFNCQNPREVEQSLSIGIEKVEQSAADVPDPAAGQAGSAREGQHQVQSWE